MQTYLLVCSCLLILAHQLLHVLYAAHLLVDLLQHRSTLLQAKQNILLHKCKFHVARQLLELSQLRVRLGQQRFLVLLAPECEFRTGGITLCKTLFGYLLLAARQDGNALLVLVQFIALVLHVQDRPGLRQRCVRA